MRIICPLGPAPMQTEVLRGFAALVRGHAVDPEFVDVSATDTSYGALIMQLWREQEPFLIVEPDIVVSPSQYAALAVCDCEYGAFPYEWATNLGPALGCTFFGEGLLAAVPVPNLARVSWRQLDTYLMRDILGHKYGWQPHVHLPAVQHLNPDKSPLRPEFQHLTIAEHLAALGWQIADDGETADYVGGDIFGAPRTVAA